MLFVTIVRSYTAIAVACLLGHTLLHPHLLLQSIPHILLHRPPVLLDNHPNNWKEVAIDSV